MAEQQPAGTDPVLLPLTGIVSVMLLAVAGYLCLAHPSPAAPLGVVGAMASALATAFGIALALRRR
ncbi:hypothetical protein ACE14D_00270 [Streptomyces sp. Act-28]